MPTPKQNKRRRKRFFQHKGVWPPPPLRGKRRATPKQRKR